MHEVRLGILTLGRGPVKVAVPLVGSNRTVLWAGLDALPDGVANLVGWRIDRLMSFLGIEMLLALVRELEQFLDSLPLLIIFRSLSEGGRLSLDTAAYREFQLRLVKEQLPDLLNVELPSGLPDPAAYITALQREHIPVIASRHFLDGMLAPQIMRETFQRMRDCNADVLKLAVMIETAKDPLSLLQFFTARRQTADRPFILIGMGPRGVLSRISCTKLGSCPSFGALRESSAPGQLPVRDLKRTLSLLPEYPVSQTAEPRK